ncbi:MAG: hypothetical protein KAT20_04210 [Desulfuromonadales bacterium]|nr:hypothetical protein [Desulfuromonadales bacterium]NOQ51760.1 hypothetical protein [Desulfuromonadaceae bacterium]
MKVSFVVERFRGYHKKVGGGGDLSRVALEDGKNAGEEKRDFSKEKIKTVRVADNLFVLFGARGSVAD